MAGYSSYCHENRNTPEVEEDFRSKDAGGCGSSPAYAGQRESAPSENEQTLYWKEAVGQDDAPWQVGGREVGATQRV